MLPSGHPQNFEAGKDEKQDERKGREREGRRGRAHRFNGVFNCDVLPVVLDVEGGAEEVAETVERLKCQSLRCCWHRRIGEK